MKIYIYLLTNQWETWDWQDEAIFLILGLYSVVTTLRHCPRCVLDSLFLSWLLIVFIEENDDSHIYVEGSIVSKSIATALVFLNQACGTMLIQKSLTKTSLCCAVSKSDVAISKTSIWRAASSIEGISVLASAVHWPSAGTENGCLRKRRMSHESLGGGFQIVPWSFLPDLTQNPSSLDVPACRAFHNACADVKSATFFHECLSPEGSALTGKLQLPHTCQQQCDFCPVVADLGDLDETWCQIKKNTSAITFLSLRKLRNSWAFLLCRFDKMSSCRSHPLQHMAFAQPANIVMQQKILVFSWHFLQQCSEKTML